MPDLANHDYARELREVYAGMFTPEGVAPGPGSQPRYQLRLAEMCRRGEGGPRDYRMAGSLYEQHAGAGANAFYTGLTHYCFWAFYRTGEGSSYWIGSPRNSRYDDAPDRRKAAKHGRKARKYLKKAAGRKPKSGVPGRAEWQVDMAGVLLEELEGS